MLDSKALLKTALLDIKDQLRDERDVVVPGRVRLQLYVRIKGECSNLSSKDESIYLQLLERLELEEEHPFEIIELSTEEGEVMLLDDGRPICFYTLVNMMQAWVCRCLGEECTYQVALDDVQHEAISEDYYKNYGCTPEESGFSPRGGSIVCEFTMKDKERLAIQLNVTCVSKLGAMCDMEMAMSSAAYLAESIIDEFEDYNLELSSAYPNKTDIELKY